MKKKDNWKIIKNFIEVISVIILVITFCKTCNNEKEIKGINYKERAILHRPNLMVIGTPEILDIKILADSLIAKDIIEQNITNLKANKPSIEDDGSQPISASAIIKFKFNITNIGNDIANIALFALTDTLSGDEEWRFKIIDNKSKRLQRIEDTSYFKQKDIKPNDTIPITFSYQIKYLDTINTANAFFTLHFIMFYYNKIGNLFDTYYWARCEIKPFPMASQIIIENGVAQVKVLWKKEEACKSIDFIGTSNNSLIYNENNSDKFKKFINSGR